MLTRLHIKGFKNFQDVDLQFGLFTCIAGRNGVGKSNLFDAITILSDLASMPLLPAALKVRGSGNRVSGLGNLFSNADSTSASAPARISLMAEMIVALSVTDDFDRKAQATATFLQYTLELAYDPQRSGDPLYIEKEQLIAKSSSEAKRILLFNPGTDWLKRHVRGPGNRRTPFIATEPGLDGAQGDAVIKLYGDKNPGRPSVIPVGKSPQTLLSGVNASSHPTALAARREMQSWRFLQLEPSALRSPDDFRDSARFGPTGAHLPNALMRIGRHAEVANKLAELIPGIVDVAVDSDEARQQRTLHVCMNNRERFAASSLSDGTLRFLALAVLACDPLAHGLVCLEEPENGIHPERIPDILKLVRSLADEVTSDDDSAAPSLRQVIINTHSPLVVSDLNDTDLLWADTRRHKGREWIYFKPLAGTWRSQGLLPTQLISKGELKAYLSGSICEDTAPKTEPETKPKPKKQRKVFEHLTPDLFDAPSAPAAD